MNLDYYSIEELEMLCCTLEDVKRRKLDELKNVENLIDTICAEVERQNLLFGYDIRKSEV